MLDKVRLWNVIPRCQGLPSSGWLSAQYSTSQQLALRWRYLDASILIATSNYSLTRGTASSLPSHPYRTLLVLHQLEVEHSACKSHKFFSLAHRQTFSGIFYPSPVPVCSGNLHTISVHPSSWRGPFGSTRLEIHHTYFSILQQICHWHAQPRWLLHAPPQPNERRTHPLNTAENLVSSSMWWNAHAMTGKLASTRTNSCSATLSYRTGDRILLVGAEKRLHPVWIEQKLVLHQSETHLDQARKQSPSINPHKNSKQWGQTSHRDLSLYVAWIHARLAQLCLAYPTKLIRFPTEQPLRVNNITCWLLRGAERVGLQQAAELPYPGITPYRSELRWFRLGNGRRGRHVNGGGSRKVSVRGGSSCSRKASSNASRVAIPCTKAAWDIRPVLWGNSRIARVSPRVRPGMRTSASCPSSRTTRSGIEAVGFRRDAGAALSDAGTGATAGVSVAVGARGMCT